MFENIIEKDVIMESLSPCSSCIHKFLTSEGCAAFVNIPIEILLGKNTHKKPLSNQENNIVYKEK